MSQLGMAASLSVSAILGDRRRPISRVGVTAGARWQFSSLYHHTRPSRRMGLAMQLVRCERTHENALFTVWWFTSINSDIVSATEPMVEELPYW